MDDVAIVAAMRAGDRAGFAAAYDAYADRLFTYCVTLLRDRDRAADAVHDAFIVGYQRIGQLRDPGRLRPWLYAIARNECLRTLRAQARSAPLEEAGEVSDETASDLGTSLREQELRRLVWTAADGLNPREREVVELSVRHGLDGPELAAALGVPTNHAHALLSKARQQLERALAAVVVARTGRAACPDLDGMLTGWDGGMTVLLRKRIARHIDSCQSCGERRRREVSASALLGAAPLLAVPFALRERVLGGFGDVDLVASHTAIAKRAGRFDRNGFPVPFGQGPLWRAWQGPAVAAITASLLLGGGVALSVGQGDDPVLAQASPGVPSLSAPAPSTLPPTLSATPSEATSSDAPEPPHTNPEPPTTPPSSDPPTSDPPPPPIDLLIVVPGKVNLFESPVGSLRVSSESDDPVEFTTSLTWTAHPETPVTWVDLVPAGGEVSEGDSMLIQVLLRSAPPQPTGVWTVQLDFHYGNEVIETVEITGCGGVCLPQP